MKNSTFESSRRSGSRFAVLGALLFLGACASQLPRPTPPQLEWAARRWPEVSPVKIESGRKLYVMKCSGCHTLKMPGAYRADRWPTIVEKMGPKAKLSKEQEEQIIWYITTVLAGPAIPKTP